MSFNKEWIHKSLRFSTIDTGVAARVKATGSDYVDISITDTSTKWAFHADADDTSLDVSVNPGGAVPGKIAFTEATTWKQLADLVNADPNWEMWLVGARPDDVPDANSLLAIADQDCTAANGYAILHDDVNDDRAFVGLTLNGPSTQIHNGDAGVLWEVLGWRCTATYASGTHTVKLYECDDDAGTSTELLSWAGGATTVLKAVPDEGPSASAALYSGTSKRFTIEATASAAYSAIDLEILGRYMVKHPAVNKNNLVAAKGF